MRGVPAPGGWGLDVAALLAGASLTFAFAPFSLWLWAPVPMAVLFLTTRGVGWRRAALRGGWFGIGQFGGGIFWIVESFQYNLVPYPVAVVVTGALVVGLALYPACAAGVLAKLAPDGGGVGLASWPAGWVLFEWLRGTLFTGFPWLQLGLGQIDGPLAGFLPLVGTYGVSFLIALVGALLAAGLARRTPRAWVALGLTLAVLGAGGAGLQSIDWTSPDGAPLAVAVVQGNYTQGEKWKPENREPTLRRYLELSRRHWGADLVVWPETAVPGMLGAMRLYLEVVEEEAARHGTELLVGIPSIDPETGRPVNAVVKLGGADGGSLYVKRHLVPFGEYIPWTGVIEPVVSALGLHLSNFQAGPREQTALTVAGRAVGMFICYEIVFAPGVRRALPEAQLLVNVSNDAWFGDTIGPHQHLQMARVRARETGRWLVRATNTGISAIIDPMGEVRGRAPQFTAATLPGEVVPHRGSTPYSATGDVPIVTALVLLGLPGVARARRGRGTRNR